MKEGQAAILSSMVFQNEIPVENKVTFHICVCVYIYIYIYDFPFLLMGIFSS